MRNRSVAICSSVDGVVCDDSGHWSRQRVMFVDLNLDGKRSQDEPLLRVDEQPHQALQLSLKAFGNSHVIGFDGEGRGVNGTFSICDIRQSLPAVKVIVSRSGRVRVTKAPAGNCLQA